MKLFLSVASAAMLVGVVSAQEKKSNVDAAALARASKCNAKSVEDDIRADLAKIGFKVEARKLTREEVNAARRSGDYHISLTETWGTPYDPHSFASGWIDGLGGGGVFLAMEKFEPPASRDELFGLVKDVLQEEDPAALQTKWSTIHNYYHSQAVMLPMWGKRIPTLMKSRLTGYEAGFQQFDYPIHRLVPISGSTTIKIAPGAQTGLFKSVGQMNAHVYGPSEFFSNNWVYEGLLAYGEGGQILPSLAASWTTAANDLGGDTYTFKLRENVKFHDGAAWDCSVAKLNFDHLLAGELARGNHGWYGVPLYTKDWSCNNDMEFFLRTNTNHGPYLQELTFIRPIRMISPNAFQNGNSSDPNSANSCHLAWGTIPGDDENLSEAVTCAGIKSISGTGPFQFVSKNTVNMTNAEGTEEEIDKLVIFTANADYWGGAPAIKQVEIVHFHTSEAVKEALLNGDLDVVWGSGVLPDADIKEIQDSVEYQESTQVFHSSALQNVILVLNSGKAPFDDINVRKTVIHAINKAAFVEKELMGLQKVVDNIFPLEAPFCDVDLTPRWDYDLEKAVLLSCDGEVATSSDLKSDSNLAVGLGIGLGLLAVIAGVAAISFYQRSMKFETELALIKNENAVDA